MTVPKDAELFEDEEDKEISAYLTSKGIEGKSLITIALLEEIFLHFSDYSDPRTHEPQWTVERASRVLTHFCRIADADIDSADIHSQIAQDFISLGDFRNFVKIHRPCEW